jgi:hypothetical protein
MDISRLGSKSMNASDRPPRGRVGASLAAVYDHLNATEPEVTARLGHESARDLPEAIRQMRAALAALLEGFQPF